MAAYASILKRKRRRGVSDKLHRLREWRNESDYEDQLTFDPESTLSSALRAGSTFASLTPPTSSSPP